MDIADYIRELILKNECVILPQFGGFISNYRPANIDREKKLLTPPSKEIEFRSDLKKDNGVLVNYIAKKKRVFSTRARRLVDEFVDELNARLNRGENVVFKGLGSFVKDSRDQEVKFFTLKDENYLIDSYGLMNLELSELEKTGNIDSTSIRIPPVKIINRKKT
ncbi:MAG: HU family DNA-binding protein, partial [Bacteroidales bacterium]